MQFTPLPMVKGRIQPGVPLPFNIRNADGTLLLARGQLIQNQEQMEALLERGALVDSEEVADPADAIRHAATAKLPALWEQSLNRVGSVLRASAQTEFVQALSEAAQPVFALIERDPDLAIFQVLRQGTSGKSQGISRSVHAAIASHLAAKRLNWDAATAHKAFKATLSMNLAELELHSRLASQTTALTTTQREQLRDHAGMSVRMLQESGVTDPDWLQAVLQHHDDLNGPGTARAGLKISEMALLLRRADIYTAKIAARATRPAILADKAARSLFAEDQGHPITAALIKEFGLYPPGCHVRLASGEMGVVVKRGEQVNTPIVAALTNRQGDALSEPVRRHCSDKAHAIVAVIPESALKVRVSPEKLVVLASGER